LEECCNEQVLHELINCISNQQLERTIIISFIKEAFACVWKQEQEYYKINGDYEVPKERMEFGKRKSPACMFLVGNILWMISKQFSCKVIECEALLCLVYNLCCIDDTISLIFIKSHIIGIAFEFLINSGKDVETRSYLKEIKACSALEKHDLSYDSLGIKIYPLTTKIYGIVLIKYVTV
jgi:hypothetical protein